MPRRCKVEPNTNGRTLPRKLPSNKYLVDQISEKVTTASITETIDKRLPGLEKKINDILAVSESLCLLGRGCQVPWPP